VVEVVDEVEVDVGTVVIEEVFDEVLKEVFEVEAEVEGVGMRMESKAGAAASFFNICLLDFSV
jgi:hypothetical protein